MPSHIRFNFSILFILLSTTAFSQFKVVGYVLPRWNQPTDLSKISFQSITHLNIAFINPDSTGNLTIPAGLDSLIQKAHEYKVKVLASLGGGSHNPYMAGSLDDSGRASFVQRLLQFTLDHNLDGIDVDLENDAIDKNYEPFIADLSTALKANGKLMTAAFATWNATIIPDPALKRFDFINVMSYDQTGPWRPTEPGPHSTYAKAESDLQYWIVTRGIAKNKVNLGLPFYGYSFGTRYGPSMSYGDIITNFPGADTLDVMVPDSGVIHYNGATTIKNKTTMALKNAGGVMIWQLLQDAEGEKSLLMAIDKIVKAAAK